MFALSRSWLNSLLLELLSDCLCIQLLLDGISEGGQKVTHSTHSRAIVAKEMLIKPKDKVQFILWHKKYGIFNSNQVQIWQIFQLRSQCKIPIILKNRFDLV